MNKTIATPERLNASGGSGVVDRKEYLGLPEMIAKGLIDTGESLGINKALLGAVTEIRVTILFVLPHLVADKRTFLEKFA
jgi:hypothetical protein